MEFGQLGLVGDRDGDLETAVGGCDMLGEMFEIKPIRKGADAEEQMPRDATRNIRYRSRV